MDAIPQLALNAAEIGRLLHVTANTVRRYAVDMADQGRPFGRRLGPRRWVFAPWVVLGQPRPHGQQELPELLTRQQAADLLGVEPDTLSRALARGELPSVRPGPRRRLIPSAALLDWLEAPQPPGGASQAG